MCFWVTSMPSLSQKKSFLVAFHDFGNLGNLQEHADITHLASHKHWWLPRQPSTSRLFPLVCYLFMSCSECILKKNVVSHHLLSLRGTILEQNNAKNTIFFFQLVFPWGSSIKGFRSSPWKGKLFRHRGTNSEFLGSLPTLGFSAPSHKNARICMILKVLPLFCF